MNVEQLTDAIDLIQRAGFRICQQVGGPVDAMYIPLGPDAGQLAQTVAQLGQLVATHPQIIINGLPVRPAMTTLSRDQTIRLARLYGEPGTYTVAYRHAVGDKAGTLGPDEYVDVREGTVITVVDTSAA